MSTRKLSTYVLDIEECAAGKDDCHVNANCNNTKGSFYCTCYHGYSGDGVTCVGKYCECVTLGLFHKLFLRYPGYKVFFQLLSDVNECLPSLISEPYRHLTHNCHADANCTNTNGSFYCACLTGYSGDGVTCVGG